MSTVAYKLSSKRKGRDRLVLVESSGPGNVPRNASKPVLAKAAAAMEEELKPLAALAETIRDALIAVNNPEKIEVEFGVELGGSLGVPLVTAGSAKANFKITLTWVNREEADK
jgi:Trypsin-co-occurring domain 1